MLPDCWWFPGLLQICLLAHKTIHGRPRGASNIIHITRSCRQLQLSFKKKTSHLRISLVGTSTEFPNPTQNKFSNYEYCPITLCLQVRVRTILMVSQMDSTQFPRWIKSRNYIDGPLKTAQPLVKFNASVNEWLNVILASVVVRHEINQPSINAVATSRNQTCQLFWWDDNVTLKIQNTFK